MLREINELFKRGFPNKEAELNDHAVVGKTISTFFDFMLDKKSIVTFVVSPVNLLVVVKFTPKTSGTHALIII